MRQEYSAYSQADHNVWSILFNRQLEILQNKASDEYLLSLQELNPVLNGNKIPNFDELNEVLTNANGWSIHIVPGLKPVGEFFKLLSERKFCSSTWLRTMEQLDYLEEPDMFHDIFGHIPLFLNKDYADFTQYIGELGARYINDDEIIKKLQRLYWYTIEFGLIKRNQGLEIYGAGIISSFGETNSLYIRDLDIRKFDLNEIFHQDFIISEIQSKYYVLNQLSNLYGIRQNLESQLVQNQVHFQQFLTN